jgi:hypothetical protein
MMIARNRDPKTLLGGGSASLPWVVKKFNGPEILRASRFRVMFEKILGQPTTVGGSIEVSSSPPE